jgi:hypothetical protein
VEISLQFNRCIFGSAYEGFTFHGGGVDIVVAMLWLFDTWEGTFGGHNIFQKTHTHVSMTVCKGRVPVEQVSDRSIRSQNTGRNSVENWEC